MTDRQIAALRYLVDKSQEASDLAKQIVVFLVNASQGLTQEVCLTLVAGRDGYSAKEITAAEKDVGGMVSANWTTHLNELLAAMGSDLVVSYHYGDFDPNRRGDKFNSDGIFANLANTPGITIVGPASTMKAGLPLRYTFWLAKEHYSQEATLITATRQDLAGIDLNRPGLYPSMENQREVQ